MVGEVDGEVVVDGGSCGTWGICGRCGEGEVVVDLGKLW